MLHRISALLVAILLPLAIQAGEPPAITSLSDAKMFHRKDAIRLTQSPSGGGNGNPAWDFQFSILDYKVGKRYQMVMRGLLVPFESAEQIERVSAPHRKALND